MIKYRVCIQNKAKRNKTSEEFIRLKKYLSKMKLLSFFIVLVLKTTSACVIKLFFNNSLENLLNFLIYV